MSYVGFVEEKTVKRLSTKRKLPQVDIKSAFYGTLEYILHKPAKSMVCLYIYITNDSIVYLHSILPNKYSYSCEKS